MKKEKRKTLNEIKTKKTKNKNGEMEIFLFSRRCFGKKKMITETFPFTF